MRIGILTGGGDAPGLNAVLRAFVKRAVVRLGHEVVGIEGSFNGLFPERDAVRPLGPLDCRGLLARGGTILGTTNRGDPFALAGPTGERVDRSADIAEGVRRHQLDGLVCVGGDGTQFIAHRLMERHGVPVLGVPKTIDNDLKATELTFGFHSAVAVATDALDRLHDTAESHDRVMLLEVMGRDAGHIALAAGIAGGADVILLPEVPWRPSRVAAKVLRRAALGRPFSIIVVAEGAVPAGMEHAALKRSGGAAHVAMEALAPYLDAELRAVVLGHIQRGGSPVPIDRLLATRFGVAAADLAHDGAWGRMVCLQADRIGSVPLVEAAGGIRSVDLDGDLVHTARSLGIELGDG